MMKDALYLLFACVLTILSASASAQSVIRNFSFDEFLLLSARVVETVAPEVGPYAVRRQMIVRNNYAASEFTCDAAIAGNFGYASFETGRASVPAQRDVVIVSALFNTSTTPNTGPFPAPARDEIFCTPITTSSSTTTSTSSNNGTSQSISFAGKVSATINADFTRAQIQIDRIENTGSRATGPMSIELRAVESDGRGYTLGSIAVPSLGAGSLRRSNQATLPLIRVPSGSYDLVLYLVRSGAAEDRAVLANNFVIPDFGSIAVAGGDIGFENNFSRVRWRANSLSNTRESATGPLKVVVGLKTSRSAGQYYRVATIEVNSLPAQREYRDLNLVAQVDGLPPAGRYLVEVYVSANGTYAEPVTYSGSVDIPSTGNNRPAPTDSGTGEPTGGSDAAAPVGRPRFTRNTIGRPGEVLLAWQTLPAATRYELYRSETREVRGNRIANQASTTFTDKDAIASKTYFYRVRGCNASGCSRYGGPVAGRSASGGSNPGAGPTDNAPTGRPRFTRNTLNLNGQVQLAWVTVPQAANYEVYRSTQRTSRGNRISIVQGRTNYDDTNVAPAVTYFYRARACNDAGCGPYAGPVAGKAVASGNNNGGSGGSGVNGSTPDFNSVLPNPITASFDDSGGFVLIDWGVDSLPDIEWEVFRAPKKEIVGQRVFRGSGRGYTDRSVVAGRTYFYRVRACQGTKCTRFRGPVAGRTSSNELGWWDPAMKVVASEGTEINGQVRLVMQRPSAELLSKYASIEVVRSRAGNDAEKSLSRPLSRFQSEGDLGLTDIPPRIETQYRYTFYICDRAGGKSFGDILCDKGPTALGWAASLSPPPTLLSCSADASQWENNSSNLPFLLIESSSWTWSPYPTPFTKWRLYVRQQSGGFLAKSTILHNSPKTIYRARSCRTSTRTSCSRPSSQICIP